MRLFAKALLTFVLLGGFVAVQDTDAGKPEVRAMLDQMAESFRNKIDDDFEMVTQIDIDDGRETWHIIVEKGRQISIGRGAHKEAEFTFLTTQKTLKRIYDGKLTAQTAAGKASGEEPAPLDLRLAEGLEFTPEIRTRLYTFLYHFFNRTDPEKILLGEEYSRMLHGAHVVALYYHPGFRSAWYMLKKGEKLNGPGDTNPYPQAFIFIEGEGYAKIGEHTAKVKAGESYYIAPNSDHVVWTNGKKPLILIWLAWGEGS